MHTFYLSLRLIVIFRAQRHQHLRLDLVTRNHAQLVALSDGGQDQLCLHHGKAAANTHAWPTRKWKVGIVRATGRSFGRKALRIEAFGVRPVIGMMLYRIRAYDDHTVRWNTISSQLVICDGFPA